MNNRWWEIVGNGRHYHVQPTGEPAPQLDMIQTYGPSHPDGTLAGRTFVTAPDIFTAAASAQRWLEVSQ